MKLDELNMMTVDYLRLYVLKREQICAQLYALQKNKNVKSRDPVNAGRFLQNVL